MSFDLDFELERIKDILVFSNNKSLRAENVKYYQKIICLCKYDRIGGMNDKKFINILSLLYMKSKNKAENQNIKKIIKEQKLNNEDKLKSIKRRTPRSGSTPRSNESTPRSDSTISLNDSPRSDYCISSSDEF